MKTGKRNDLVPLGLLNRRLAALTGQEPPGYAMALRAALDGALPAQKVGGRGFVAETDLVTAAAVLGMAVGPAKPAPPVPGQPAGPRPGEDKGAPAAKRRASKAHSPGGAGAHRRAGNKAVQGQAGTFPHPRVRRDGLA